MQVAEKKCGFSLLHRYNALQGRPQKQKFNPFKCGREPLKIQLNFRLISGAGNSSTRVHSSALVNSSTEPKEALKKVFDILELYARVYTGMP
jgi:hypothetical protein